MYCFFRELKKSLIRNPLKDKKRFRSGQKAITNGSEPVPAPMLPTTSPALGRSLNRSSVCDYLDISGNGCSRFQILSTLFAAELSVVTFFCAKRNVLDKFDRNLYYVVQKNELAVYAFLISSKCL